jgi:hypothetical protein
VQWDKSGVVYIAMWVDDCFYIEDKEALEDAIKKLGKHFKLKVEHSQQDDLSCKIIFDEDQTKAWIGQLHLIKKIKNEFGGMVRKMPDY